MLYTIWPSFSVAVVLSDTEAIFLVGVKDAVPWKAVVDGMAIFDRITVVDEIGEVVVVPWTLYLSRPSAGSSGTSRGPDEVSGGQFNTKFLAWLEIPI